MAFDPSLQPTRRKWVVDLFGCCSYKDPSTHESLVYPLFCPLSMICSGLVVGKILTKVYDEKPCCGDMGCYGTCCCLMTVPVHFGSPCGGLSMFVCLSYWLREKVIAKYNVEETETCCCGSLNPYCEFAHINCNFPCSFFQMYVSIREWERQVTVLQPSSVTNGPSAPVINSQMHPSSPSQQNYNPPSVGTPVAIPRNAAPAMPVYAASHPNMTPVRAIPVTAQNAVQVAVPVATPVGAVQGSAVYYN